MCQVWLKAAHAENDGLYPCLEPLREPSSKSSRPTDNRLPSWSGILRFRRPVDEGSSVFQKKFDKELKTEENPCAL
jgi:hypothetical protein